MQLESKEKILQAIGQLQETCIVKENVYKCGQDGMVCFNGFIAELINGNKYEWEDYEDEIYEEAYESELQSFVTDLENNRERDPKHPNYMDDVEWEEYVTNETDNFQPDIETFGEALEVAQEEMTSDLTALYTGNNTLQEINDIHYNWVSDQIDFDLAAAEFERLIVEQE